MRNRTTFRTRFEMPVPWATRSTGVSRFFAVGTAPMLTAPMEKVMPWPSSYVNAPLLSVKPLWEPDI
jgi:hypothetical protein